MHDNDHQRARPSIVMNSDGTVATCCFIPMIAILVAGTGIANSLLHLF